MAETMLEVAPKKLFISLRSLPHLLSLEDLPTLPDHRSIPGEHQSLWGALTKSASSVVKSEA